MLFQIEEKIGIECLDQLKQAFEAADEDGSGKLTLAEFKLLLKTQLSIPTSKVNKQKGKTVKRVAEFSSFLVLSSKVNKEKGKKGSPSSLLFSYHHQR